jgi:hypothetical protein
MLPVQQAELHLVTGQRHATVLHAIHQTRRLLLCTWKKRNARGEEEQVSKQGFGYRWLIIHTYHHFLQTEEDECLEEEEQQSRHTADWLLARGTPLSCIQRHHTQQIISKTEQEECLEEKEQVCGHAAGW